METFNGFEQPKQNWSKLPHQLIDALPQIETIGEMKVILYILRHTWGYHDTEKRITLDEFQNGRRRKDGSRIDNGTGLSIPTIRSGIDKAIEHGFIQVETDDSDLARVKKFYSLITQTEKDLHSECKKLSPRVKETFNRSEKDTLERNSEKETKKSDLRKSPTSQPTLLEVSDSEKTDLDPQRKSDLLLKAAIAADITARTGRNAQGPRKFKTLEQKRAWRAACAKIHDANNGTSEQVLSEFIRKAQVAGRTDLGGIVSYVAKCAENGGRLFESDNHPPMQLQTVSASECQDPDEFFKLEVNRVDRTPK